VLVADSDAVAALSWKRTQPLWREKWGEAEPEDLSGNLIVQLGSATEDTSREAIRAAFESAR